MLPSKWRGMHISDFDVVAMLRALMLAARPAARPHLDAVRDQERDADDATARRRLLHAHRQRGGISLKSVQHIRSKG
eukprot:802922-Prymnesium_polylepis.1